MDRINQNLTALKLAVPWDKNNLLLHLLLELKLYVDRRGRIIPGGSPAFKVSMKVPGNSMISSGITFLSRRYRTTREFLCVACSRGLFHQGFPWF